MILGSIAVGTVCLLPLYVIYFVQIKKRENPDNPSSSLTPLVRESSRVPIIFFRAQP
jgi:hypothetical protein